MISMVIPFRFFRGVYLSFFVCGSLVSYMAITKHAYIILTPLNPIFFIVKLGFTGVYSILLISAPNIDCGYSLEPPHRGGSNE